MVFARHYYDVNDFYSVWMQNIMLKCSRFIILYSSSGTHNNFLLGLLRIIIHYKVKAIQLIYYIMFSTKFKIAYLRRVQFIPNQRFLSICAVRLRTVAKSQTLVLCVLIIISILWYTCVYKYYICIYTHALVVLKLKKYIANGYIL